MALAYLLAIDVHDSASAVTYRHREPIDVRGIHHFEFASQTEPSQVWRSTTGCRRPAQPLAVIETRVWPSRWGRRRLPVQPSLVNEDRPLTAEHPQVVERLTAYAERAREELGDIGRVGTGQRAAGHYPDPRPLWLNRVEYVAE